VDAVRHSFQKVFEELPGRSAIGLVDQLLDRKLAGALNADEQLQLPFGGLHFNDIQVEEPDRVALETLPLRFVALNIG